MAQNNEYQNVKEEEPYYDDLKQTKIPRTGKFCFKIYDLWTCTYIFRDSEWCDTKFEG